MQIETIDFHAVSHCLQYFNKRVYWNSRLSYVHTLYTKIPNGSRKLFYGPVLPNIKML